MSDIVKQWISVIALLVFVYLVVRNASGAASIISSLSSANTNAISALQGNRVGV